LGLDFIPQFSETYEILVPEAYLTDPLVQTMLSTSTEPEFQKRVLKMPGYTVDKMGEIRVIV
jgi:putative molybdopterin biosynthesis protein